MPFILQAKIRKTELIILNRIGGVGIKKSWSVILHEKPPNLLKTQRIDGFFDSLADGE